MKNIYSEYYKSTYNRQYTTVLFGAVLLYKPPTLYKPEEYLITVVKLVDFHTPNKGVEVTVPINSISLTISVRTLCKVGELISGWVGDRTFYDNTISVINRVEETS